MWGVELQGLAPRVGIEVVGLRVPKKARHGV